MLLESMDEGLEKLHEDRRVAPHSQCLDSRPAVKIEKGVQDISSE